MRISLFFALVLSVLISISLQITALPWQVTNAMASREIRYHHFVWHNVRNLWNQLDNTTKTQIASYGWTPPRPAKDSKGNSIKDNNSGQDFFYFHRKMIANVQYLMNKTVNQTVSLWNVIPTKTNKTYPMAAEYTAPTAQLTKLVKYYKSDAYYKYLKAQEKKMTDPEYLRSVTLGQFGSYMEFASDVHQGLHFRFSAINKMMRVKSNVAIPYIDPKWDVNTSDWLADIYCSQVNPWFWKIHGWIDNRINDWAKANGVKNITWNATWLGGNTTKLPQNLSIPADPNDRFLAKDSMEGMDMSSSSDASGSMDSMDMGVMNITALEKVAEILIKSGLSCDYFNELEDKDGPHPWENEEENSCDKKN